VNFRAYWSDPMWRGLRVVTIVTASATVAILIGYLVVGKSWLVPLVAMVIANVGLNLALVIRTLIVRAKLRHPPES
jgi:hypothetical protein